MRLEVLLATLGQLRGTIFGDAASRQVSGIVMNGHSCDTLEAGEESEILGLVTEIYLLGIMVWELRNVVLIYVGHLCGSRMVECWW